MSEEDWLYYKIIVDPASIDQVEHIDGLNESETEFTE
jgi:hypothetical protein